MWRIWGQVLHFNIFREYKVIGSLCDDALYRLTIATDPKNQTTTYVHRFDTGVLAALTVPRGNTTRWSHNALVQILTKRYQILLAQYYLPDNL